MIKAGFIVQDWGVREGDCYVCLFNYDGTNTIGYMGTERKPSLEDHDKYLVAVFTLKQLKWVCR